jgi:hypothetical protein
LQDLRITSTFVDNPRKSFTTLTKKVKCFLPTQFTASGYFPLTGRISTLRAHFLMVEEEAKALKPFQDPNDMFAKGLNNLKSQFGNVETIAVNNIPSIIGSTNKVFKFRTGHQTNNQKQRIPPKGSKVTPFAVFNRPSITTPFSPTTPSYPRSSLMASKTIIQKTLDGESSKVGIPIIL